MRITRAGLRVAAAMAVLTAAALHPPRPALAAPPHSPESDDVPIAGAFVYPVGDELDFTRARSGESHGYYVSDPYMAHRGSKNQRIHQGCDLSCGSGGAAVHAIASGTVVVADANALVKTRRKVEVKTTKVVKGKTITKTGWKWKTSTKWRTGWGNYVVLKHVLPSGESVYSLYGHLMPASVCVAQGDIVAAGETIGQVGKTGRASSPHLHLEIRKNAPAGDEERSEDETEIEPTVQDRTFALLATTDPIDFLDKHVRRFEDLEPGSWQARYAFAACKDGLAAPDEKRFGPDESMDRGEFYRSLVLAFRLSTAFPVGDWTSTVSSLVQAGVLDQDGSEGQKPGDKLTQADGLEMVLRCLERHRARAPNLASLDPMQVGLDFNRRFAGDTEAEVAAKKSKVAAMKATEAKKKAEADRVASARKAAKAAGKKSRVKARTVKPVAPMPILDPGFEALAQSKKTLTRAEGCLLLATTLRAASERMSALQRAAVRVAQSE
ncbi:MAG TPA: M23 family metallopeptidase [Candidatus Eisenbacteria bacterium]|nr:M23 family metallopeptidase [Candidatus Eisenbacteria bacterium]